MENPLRKNHFAHLFLSIEANSHSYSSQSIEKPALKWIPLTGASIQGQPPSRLISFFKWIF